MITLNCFIINASTRRERDSNPRYPLEVHTLSRRANSTTLASLLSVFERATKVGDFFVLQKKTDQKSHCSEKIIPGTI